MSHKFEEVYATVVAFCLVRALYFKCGPFLCLYVVCLALSFEFFALCVLEPVAYVI